MCEFLKQPCSCDWTRCWHSSWYSRHSWADCTSIDVLQPSCSCSCDGHANGTKYESTRSPSPSYYLASHGKPSDYNPDRSSSCQSYFSDYSFDDQSRRNPAGRRWHDQLYCRWNKSQRYFRCQSRLRTHCRPLLRREVMINIGMRSILGILCWIKLQSDFSAIRVTEADSHFRSGRLV